MKLRLLLFAGGALISAFTILQGIDPFDEGIALSAARRVSEGQVPYADFTWAYGPVTPYPLGGLFKLFGTSLLQWRVLGGIAGAAVALTGFVLLRPWGPPQGALLGWLAAGGAGWAPPKVALLGWLAAACAMAAPRSANPFPFALLFALLALLSAAGERRVVMTAAMTGLAAAFRLDFALYAAAGVTALLVLERRYRETARYLAFLAAFTALIYLPFLIDIGPADLYRALIGPSLHDRDYWTLPFPFGYDGSLDLWRPHALKDLLDHYQPLILGIGL